MTRRPYTMSPAALEVRRLGGRASQAKRGNRGHPLPAGQWARAWPRCQDCGRTDRPHAAGGRCGPCYLKSRRPVRVEDLDPELGYLVSGTHDVERARAAVHASWGETHPCGLIDSAPRLVWFYKVPARGGCEQVGECDHAWHLVTTTVERPRAARGVLWERAVMTTPTGETT